MYWKWIKGSYVKLFDLDACLARYNSLNIYTYLLRLKELHWIYICKLRNMLTLKKEKKRYSNEIYPDFYKFCELNPDFSLRYFRYSSKWMLDIKNSFLLSNKDWLHTDPRIVSSLESLAQTWPLGCMRSALWPHIVRPTSSEGRCVHKSWTAHITVDGWGKK